MFDSLRQTPEAEVGYRSEKSDMHNYFLLVQNEQDKWQIVSTMAITEPK